MLKIYRNDFFQRLDDLTGAFLFVWSLAMSMNPKDEKVKSDKYRRDGAKYVCTKCKKKFFDKNEVEKCYDSHSDAPPK